MSLASSTETPMFRIDYSVQVFVKHDSKLEFGQGNSVTFNFEIKSEPQGLPDKIQMKEQNWMTAMGITQWEVLGPQYPPVNLYFEKNPDLSLEPKSSWDPELVVRNQNGENRRKYDLLSNHWRR